MNRARIVAIAIIACLVLSIPATALAKLKIKEIFYNSPGADTGSNTSLNAEWVQLHNTASHAVRLAGWKVRDAAGHVYRFGTFKLGAGASVKIHTGHGSNTHKNVYWGSGNYIWNNDGDTATLKRPGGTVADRCHYSDPSETNDHVNC